MNLHAVFVSDHHVIRSPGVSSQDHSILIDMDTKNSVNLLNTKID